jgi:hypothetical protein
MVDLIPTDPNRCAAYRDALIARYGPGESETRKDAEHNIDFTSIEWPGAKPDRLTYSDAHRGERFGLCKLIVQKR